MLPLGCQCSGLLSFGQTARLCRVRTVGFSHEPNEVTLTYATLASAAVVQQAGSFSSLRELHVVLDSRDWCSCCTILEDCYRHTGLASILTALPPLARDTLKSISVLVRMNPHSPKSRRNWLDVLVYGMERHLSQFAKVEVLSFTLPRAYHDAHHSAAWWLDKLRTYMPWLQASVLVQVHFYGKRVGEYCSSHDPPHWIVEGATSEW